MIPYPQTLDPAPTLAAIPVGTATAAAPTSGVAHRIPAVVDVTHNVLVTGHRGTGVTNTLRVIIAGLLRCPADIWEIDLETDHAHPGVSRAAHDIDQALEMLNTLQTGHPRQRPVVVVFHSLTELCCNYRDDLRNRVMDALLDITCHVDDVYLVAGAAGRPATCDTVPGGLMDMFGARVVTTIHPYDDAAARHLDVPIELVQQADRSLRLRHMGEPGLGLGVALLRPGIHAKYLHANIWYTTPDDLRRIADRFWRPITILVDEGAELPAGRAEAHWADISNLARLGRVEPPANNLLDTAGVPGWLRHTAQPARHRYQAHQRLMAALKVWRASITAEGPYIAGTAAVDALRAYDGYVVAVGGIPPSRRPVDLTELLTREGVDPQKWTAILRDNNRYDRYVFIGQLFRGQIAYTYHAAGKCRITAPHITEIGAPQHVWMVADLHGRAAYDTLCYGDRCHEHPDTRCADHNTAVLSADHVLADGFCSDLNIHLWQVPPDTPDAFPATTATVTCHQPNQNISADTSTTTYMVWPGATAPEEPR